jgi:hypothetical protein
LVDWSQILTLLVTILGGSYGLLRIFSYMAEAAAQKAVTDSKILLTKAEAEAYSDKSLQTQMSSLIELIRTQMLQQAQSEADKTKAQNDLTSSIRDMIDEFKSVQRAASNNIEDILRAYKQDVGKIELGFRGISDEFLIVNGAFTRNANKMDLNMDSIRSMIQDTRRDLQQLERKVDSSADNLDDVVELVVEVRNRVLAWIHPTSTEPLIRSATDMTPPRLPGEQTHEKSLSFPDADIVLYAADPADTGAGSTTPAADIHAASG